MAVRAFVSSATRPIRSEAAAAVAKSSFCANLATQNPISLQHRMCSCTDYFMCVRRNLLGFDRDVLKFACSVCDGSELMHSRSCRCTLCNIGAPVGVAGEEGEGSQVAHRHDVHAVLPVLELRSRSSLWGV